MLTALVLIASGAGDGPVADVDAIAGEARPGKGAAATAPVSATGVEPSIAGALLGLFPGLGLGHLAAGDTQTGKRLLTAGGVSTLVFLGGGIPLLVTRASRQVVWFAVPSIALGIGGLFLVAAADAYGAGSGKLRTGTAPRDTPRVSVSAGFTYAPDPVFAYTSFAVVRARLNLAGLWLEPRAAIALDDDHQRWTARVGYRFVGPRPDRTARDGSVLELVSSLQYHDFNSNAFAVLIGELYVVGRLDLDRVGASLGGAFAEVSVGWGIELPDYDLVDFTFGDESSTLAVARVAFGLALGEGDGEVQIFYDHRRNGLAGGIGMDRVVGFLGHAGIEGWWFFDDNWGAAAQVHFGSLVTATARAVYRY